MSYINVLGGIVVGFSLGLMTKIVISEKTTVNVKPADAPKEPTKLDRELANQDLRRYIVDNFKFCHFDKEWNNGTGYFNNALTAEVEGAEVGDALYAVCPITGRMVIILYKIADGGENVVIFKRYTNASEWSWSFQGGRWKYKELLGISDIEFVDSTLSTAPELSVVLKRYCENK